MTLLEVTARLSSFPEEAVIFAESPWSAASFAVVVENEMGMVMSVGGRDLEYFLEISISLEVMDGFRKYSKHHSTESCCKRLIDYAINDA
jgi:hypothetical protein